MFLWNAGRLETCDIGFGPCRAMGGIRYTLLFIDKKTRLKRIYGLKNLTSSVLRAFKKFVRDDGIHPKLIRTDFDQKLIGGPVAEYLEEQKIGFRQYNS